MFLLTPVLSVTIEWRKQSCFNMSGKTGVHAATKNVSDLCPKNLSILLLAGCSNLKHIKEDLIFLFAFLRKHSCIQEIFLH